jgi:demethylmenaquinone methyltransferase/2-methoxy-6-polyprenyl-1,4-benzoquinol methylase
MQVDAPDDQQYRSYTTESFARWARIYDAFASLLRIQGVRRETVEMSGVQPGERVLDVCTGTGDLALAFARQCDDVTGIDLSEDMLAVARNKDREGKVQFLQMDATRLDFADEEFDLSAISFGLHDMPPGAREEVLREMARVTRNRVMVVDYNPPRNPILRALYVAIVSLYESRYFPGFCRSDFEGLLARCGLEVGSEKPTYLGFVRLCLALPNR